METRCHSAIGIACGVIENLEPAGNSCPAPRPIGTSHRLVFDGSSENVLQPSPVAAHTPTASTGSSYSARPLMVCILESTPSMLVNV